MRVFSTLGFATTLWLATASAQNGDLASLQGKVEEALKARDASASAFAQGQVEEGRKLGETSVTLLREARIAFDAMDAAGSKDFDLLMAYAGLLVEQGDHDLAEKALLRAVEIDRESAAAWLKLGQTESRLGPRGETRAIRSLRQAAAIQPKTEATVQAYASLGALYQQAGLYDFARETYAKAVEQDPNHVGSKLAIAALDARDGEVVKANAAYQEVEEKSTEYRGFIKNTLGIALQDFEQSRRWLNDSAETHLAYAELLVRAERLDDAIWPLNRSLKLDDSNYVAWNLMGSALRAMNQLKPARDAFAKSIALNPDQPRTQEAIDAIDKEMPPSPPAPAAPPAQESQPAPADAPVVPQDESQSASPTPPAATEGATPATSTPSPTT
ncbi:MAG: tetratricopeptide repeat protein [Candidatus Hydrogenedentes bacterium]|nr:tetratricopeptide repeat protein [Candidatus Hydrogenedentota bacterium]